MPIKAAFVGDTTDLHRSTEQARADLRKVGDEAQGAARVLKAAASSFDGTRIEGAALRAIKGMERVGGVTKLTSQELTQLDKKVQSAIDKFRVMGTDVPPGIQRVARDIAHVRALEEDLARSTAQTTSALRAQGQSIGAGIAASLNPMQALDAAAGRLGISLSQGLGVAGVGAVTALGAGLVTAVGKAVAYGSAVNDIAIKAGISAEAVQELQFAAEQNGNTIDQVSAALSRMSNNLVENSKETSGAIRSIGLSVSELRSLAPDEAFTRIATAIAEIPDPMQRANVAIDIFGKSGADLLPTMIGNLEATRQKARDLGLVMANDLVAAADDLGDSWDQLTASGSMLVTRAVGPLIPLLLELAKAMQTVSMAGIGSSVRVGVDEALAQARQAIRSIPGASWTPIGMAALGTIDQYRGNLAAAYDLDADRRRVIAAAATVIAGPTQAAAAALPAAPPRQAGSAAKAEKATKTLTDLQRALNAETEKAFTVARRAEQGWDEYASALDLARMEMEAFIAAQPDTLLGAKPLSASALMLTGPYQYQISSNMTAGVLHGTKQIEQATKDWRLELRGVVSSFAQLAQIAGPSLDGVTRGIGTTLASVDASRQLIDALGAAVPGLGLRDAQGNVTGRGRALSASLAALTTGAALGSTTSNPWLGGALGGGGGLATGLMLGASGATLGLSAGVGAAAAIYSASRNRQAQRAAMEQQRQSIIASMGGVDDFREAVERAGFEYEYFLSLFNSSDPDDFTDAVNRLNTALQEQETRAASLTRGLEEVSRVQGVISQQQWAQIVNTDPNGPGAEDLVAFAAQQREQAAAGIAQAIAALDTATAGGTQHMEDYTASIGATTASLVVLFDTALRQGDSAITVLQRLAEPIQTLQRLLAAAGQTPGAGFAQLQSLSRIATGEQTGPLVSLAQGLGQALAGFANTGLLSPDLFAELANGIGEAYHQLELLGQGGLDAARLLQPSLQAIWQMTQDNPALRDTLDDTTRSLLDFAESSGLIGEDFRPAVDQMIDALQDLIATLREWIDLVAQMPGMPALPTPPGATPAPSAPSSPGSPGGSPANGGDYTTPFAQGGIVTRPTRALIGEAGPEAVIPLTGWRGMPSATEQTVQVVLDGRVLASSVVREMPRLVRVYTGAA